jgi:translation initiation factor IF-2
VAAPKPWPLRSPARAKPRPGPRSPARASPRPRTPQQAGRPGSDQPPDTRGAQAPRVFISFFVLFSREPRPVARAPPQPQTSPQLVTKPPLGRGRSPWRPRSRGRSEARPGRNPDPGPEARPGPVPDPGPRSRPRGPAPTNPPIPGEPQPAPDTGGAAAAYRLSAMVSF